ncbi:MULTISPECIES: putative quinol monooxygenase [Streptosporangium]|uniref:Quinol monooxygenase YgiN n=1 Tax=Streptosporangium brasiliense TaxID=47480 RepID=A0ABT9QW76_9ACTN|nr:antibiotic biosynthesis monooxygenase [Streptosporangium brasiliense]MDP9861234.1 quinol monooxygenase YgiN [Streptosporangium brasiliense]
MVSLGFLVPLEAKPGKEAEVERFLDEALHLAEAEPETVAWFAIRLSPSLYAIVDFFPDESGRETHLSGEVAKALMEKAPDLFEKAPNIIRTNVIAAKLPG